MDGCAKIRENNSRQYQNENSHNFSLISGEVSSTMFFARLTCFKLSKASKSSVFFLFFLFLPDFTHTIYLSVQQHIKCNFHFCWWEIFVKVRKSSLLFVLFSLSHSLTRSRRSCRRRKNWEKLGARMKEEKFIFWRKTFFFFCYREEGKLLSRK